jgi:hypothetical protein
MARPSILLEKALAATCVAALSACQPTVRVEAPDKPIEINLNVRIEQEVRVRVERDLEQVFRDDPELFGLPKGGKKP